jgi:CcmD family protein
MIYLFAAFVAAWLGVFLYHLRLNRKIERLERRLKLLEPLVVEKMEEDGI